jgi:hypothetical protein
MSAGPKSKSDPPPDPTDFADFLSTDMSKNFTGDMLADIADNGLDGKFKNTYTEWFHDKVIKEVMEDDEFFEDKDK